MDSMVSMSMMSSGSVPLCFDNEAPPCVSLMSSKREKAAVTYTYSCTNDWLFSEAQVKDSPSARDGMTWGQENEARKEGVMFCYALSKVFGLPDLVQATAKQFFHRFFIRESFLEHDKYLIAATCLFLASKAEDRPIHVVRFAKYYLLQLKKLATPSSPAPPMYAGMRVTSDEAMSELLLATECQVLYALAYDLDLTFPHLMVDAMIAMVVSMHTDRTEAQKMELTATLKRTTASFLNDSARTPICLRFSAHQIAAGAVFLAGKFNMTVPCSVRQANGDVWHAALLADENALIVTAECILEAYLLQSIEERTLPTSIIALLNIFHPYRHMEDTEADTDQGGQEDSDVSYDGEDAPQFDFKTFRMASCASPTSPNVVVATLAPVVITTVSPMNPRYYGSAIPASTITSADVATSPKNIFGGSLKRPRYDSMEDMVQFNSHHSNSTNWTKRMHMTSQASPSLV